MSDASRLLNSLYNVYLKKHNEEVALQKLKKMGKQLVSENDIMEEDLKDFLDLVEPNDINAILSKLEKYKKKKKPKPVSSPTPSYSDPCGSSRNYRSYC